MTPRTHFPKCVLRIGGPQTNGAEAWGYKFYRRIATQSLVDTNVLSVPCVQRVVGLLGLNAARPNHVQHKAIVER